MDPLDTAIAETKLKRMLSRDHFNICDVDDLLKFTQTIPERRAYERLRMLHCVDYKDMPREVLTQIPSMLSEVFNGPMIDVGKLTTMFYSNKKALQ